MATITSTLTITSNASGASVPGPLSMALSLSDTFSPTVVTVKSAKAAVSTSAAALFTDALQAEGDTAGTHGAFLYLKNSSPADHDIHIGFEVSAATPAEIQGAGAAL